MPYLRTTMAVKEKEPQYISRTGLKGKRGWTDLLIKRFLPEPDKTVDNPHYKSAEPMKLWLISRVDEIEKTDEFIAVKSVTAVRKQKANKAVATKRAKIMGYVDFLKIDVPVFTREELIRKACSAYNQRNAHKQYNEESFWTPADENSDWHFLNRICTNYLRHQCTRYETELEKIFGKVGNEEAYTRLKKKVNEAILKAYNFLEPVPEFSNI